MLELNQVTKHYGSRTALDGVTLDIAAGEVIAIIGPSGCGKSTLLKTINGLEPIQGGTITFDGTQIAPGRTDWRSVRQDIGMVFQSYELFPHLNVMQNLLLGPKVVQRADTNSARERASELLARVGLAGREEAMPRELSGGQKQRVAIVRALMMNPKVLLLDEITASLDPEIVREVLDVVADLAKSGITMLLVTHEMPFARAVSDRVVFMDAGRIVETGKPEEFFDNPQTERAQRFLDRFVF
ncbi:amino acid ABC transporter ATP-binding protein [Corynebacterium epidermidicanis]|uniref:Amino acid ABC transporter ATP-binding protein n=1 Tax=Corynebacterium epidermidicanis TaxID=1050174 RepID=A0A0G3GN73_9CORY|nr:amino acid ABC transporter ATP-binding protein [Corynebacterium epidermidicanis]AKK02010.1 amino acid ABC transporter ATP-binding protein [Corynebacterium epidermidicanis]